MVTVAGELKTKFCDVSPVMFVNVRLSKDDCHWYVNTPLPPLEAVPVRMAGAAPSHTVWLEEIVPGTMALTYTSTVSLPWQLLLSTPRAV